MQTENTFIIFQINVWEGGWFTCKYNRCA